MTERKKVIRGLESLHVRLLDAATRDKIAMLDAMIVADALALLKPRLLSEEDFIDNPNVDSEGNLPAWIEFRRDKDWAEYWDDTKDEWAIVRKTNFKATGYRCWNAKPSKEQMKATEWEKEDDDAASSEKP